MSWDPIGEMGGLHLYTSFQNSPCQFVDPLGQWPKIDPVTFKYAACLLCAYTLNPRAETCSLESQWSKSSCDNDKCHRDAMQHCIGGSLLAARCGSDCVDLVGSLQELAQGEWDKMDLANNEAGAKCNAEGQAAVDCCARMLDNGELDTTNGSCE